MTDDLGQQIVEAVRQHGWYVVNVEPQPDGSVGNEVCSYTIGISKTLGWPEMICFGRVAEEAHQMIQFALAECWEDKIEPRDGLMLSKVLEGRNVKLVQNDEALKNYFGLAEWYAEQIGQPSPRRLQLVWPDQYGHFPDEVRCEPAVREAQTPRLSA